jgi:tetratricopeptide (TPR) repeat protein
LKFGRGIGPTGSPEQVQAQQQQLRANPGDRIARHNLAVALRRMGQPEEALIEAERLWSEGFHRAETAVVRGNLLADAGRFDDAISAYRDAVRIKPEQLEAHQVLASLLPQLGRADEALDSLRAGLESAPEFGPLWAMALDTAKSHHQFGQLLEWAQAAGRQWPDDAVLETYRATALSGLGQDQEALAVLDRIIAREPGYGSAFTTKAHVLLRLGDPAAAALAAERASQLDQTDQAAWSLLGVAWRLLDDPREHWLCDYDTFVMPIEIGTDPDLLEALGQRHAVSAHPADQSLRGGTQTRGNLFETLDPVILALAFALRDAAEERISHLPFDPTHPFLSRNTGSLSFPTSWSIRLRSEGFHVSHIHPVGWMSSAYYAHLPPEVQAGQGQGALAFGVPDSALGLDLPPRRVVQPKEGQLVLFPSYLWHGTTPFESAEPRITVAFDMLPVDNAAG